MSSETKHTPSTVSRRMGGPFVVDTSSLCHGVDRVSRVAVCDQTPAQNLLGFVDPEWAETVVTSVNARPKVEELVERVNEINEPLWERPQGNTPSKGEWAAIVKKIREVEAALKGETGG